MTPPLRPVDDYSLLPRRLRDLDHDGPHLRPERIEVRISADRTISGIVWGPDPPTVVYLHGGGQNAHTWDLVAALLGEPALALDLPGHGHSSWRSDSDYDPVTNAVAVAQTLDRLRAQPLLVVGMSLGGLTALALAASRADLVKDLVLIDILPGIETTVSALSGGEVGAVALLHGPMEFDSLTAMEHATMAAIGIDRLDESLQRGVWHNAVQLPSGRWRWRYDNLRADRRPATSGLWASLETSPAPLTLIKGGDSPFVNQGALARLRQLRPDAHTVVVPGVGHAVQSEDPLSVAGVLRARIDEDRREARDSA